MFHLVELSAGPVEGGAQVAGGDRGQADRVHGHHGKVWTSGLPNVLLHFLFFNFRNGMDTSALYFVQHSPKYYVL